ncbi:uncharacterized protein LOC127782269 [Oryza glaberrima]|uniref:uncharacterized protein LOC127782269 n=1 Tax=Oryza glaberrima TaxID=4538 RepID=UPI00224C045A|nr:uncharacterized protein LOC127782269 [Oryza glaberrima]XP_052165359.1 uncharacterized protein LOC127782269 [Oryza glaberrima]
MSSGKGKRKMEEEGVPLQGDLDPDNDPMKYALSAPRVQIIPGLWRRIVRRRRSKNDAKPWACPCGYVNKPIQHLFFDLPRFKCGSRECKEMIPDDYEFKFSLVDIEANGVCLLNKVKDQDSRPHCMAYASAVNADITSKVTSVLLGEAIRDAKSEICMRTFLQKLKLKKQLPRSLDMNTYDDLGIKDLWKIISILEKDGVETVDGSHKARISGITHVPLDFPVICKEIAEGHPLLAIIRTGKGFDDLQYNQIYKPPKVSRIVDGKSAGLHCISLVGGAMRKGRKMHFKFVNTHGEEFCKLRSLNRDDGIKGGLGNVIAEGILRRPVKFLREGREVLKQ